MPCPTTARGLGCCFQTPCSISIAKTQQIIPCLPHFLLLNEHSSRPDELSNLSSSMLNSKIRQRAVVGYGELRHQITWNTVALTRWPSLNFKLYQPQLQSMLLHHQMSLSGAYSIVSTYMRRR